MGRFTKNEKNTAVYRYGNLIINLVISSILARLLSPEEFGIVAMVLVFTPLFNLIGDFGLSKGVLQDNSLTARDHDSIFVFSLYFSLLLSIVFYFLGSTVASFFEEIRLEKVVKVLALGVFFSSGQAVLKAILEKIGTFKKIASFTIIAQLFSGVIAIYLAFRGFSYWSLIWRILILNIIIFISFFVTVRPKLSLTFSIESVLKILNFSAYNFGFNIVNYFARNGDNFLIGKYMGSSNLAFYEKAYTLMMLPVYNLTYVFTPVLLPDFAQKKNDINYVRRRYKNLITFLFYCGVIIGSVVSLFSKEVVLFVYGKQWLYSANILAVFAIFIPLQMIYSTVGSVLLAYGMSQYLFKYSLVNSVLILGSVFLGIYSGASIVEIGILVGVVFTISFLFIMVYLMREIISYTRHDVIEMVLTSFRLYGVLILPFLFVCFELVEHPVSKISLLLMQIVLIVYHAFKFDRELFIRIVRNIRTTL